MNVSECILSPIDWANLMPLTFIIVASDLIINLTSVGNCRTGYFLKHKNSESYTPKIPVIF